MITSPTQRHELLTSKNVREIKSNPNANIFAGFDELVSLIQVIPLTFRLNSRLKLFLKEVSNGMVEKTSNRKVTA